MKAEELMIGDWVQMPKGTCRVISIQDNDVIFTDIADGIDGSFYINEVKAIPITPEVLEKNGFVKQGFSGWEIYTEDFLILWRNDYPDILEIRSFNAAYGYFYRSYISYVHELQHALRLCGIEKEVVL